MSPEAQRIAIAEECGWRHQPVRPSETERLDLRWKYVTDLPDYTRDLNAMHRAEEVLLDAGTQCNDWGPWERYVEYLTDWLGSEGAISATAERRAKAFLMAVNKWVTVTPAEASRDGGNVGGLKP